MRGILRRSVFLFLRYTQRQKSRQAETTSVGTFQSAMMDGSRTMTKNQRKAKELYHGIRDKEHISQEFLYDAICYFELEPEQVVELLNAMPVDAGVKLYEAFGTCRTEVRKNLQKALEEHDFSVPFQSPEIEDILFYQMAHGYPIC
jgi:hypothetical protein